GALHGRVAHPEGDLGPAQLGVAQHVLLGVRVLAGDEADALRQERQGLLALGVEQALLAQRALQPLELGEQVAEARVTQLGGDHREGSAAHPVVGLDARDHPVALRELFGEALQGRAPHGERDGGVLLEVLQLRVDDPAREIPLGQLALDPHRAEAIDVALELVREASDRPGGLGGRLRGHALRLRDAADRTLGGVSAITNGRLGTALEAPRMPVQRERLRDLPVAGTKRVLLAAPRGYCAGVDRAVIAVEKALENYGSPVYVRKQIVHNVHVVSELERRGAIFVDEVDEVPPGSHLVFSAHGVSPMVVQAAADRGLEAIDATCPLVTKVHREAVRFSKQNMQILLIGHAGHEEVEGTMGHAPERTILVNSPDEADTIEVDDPDNLVWISQTTLSVDETMETVRRL